MGSGLVRVPWYGQVGAVAAFAAALFLVVRLYYLGPQLEGLEEKRAALARKQDELAQARRDREELARFQNRVDDLTLRLGRLGAALPEQEHVSEMLRRLQFVAVRSNLTIRAFRPQPAVARDQHTEWSYQVHLDGSYHNLARFFDRIGGLSRIITIGDVVIRAADAQEPDRTIAAEGTVAIVVPIEPSERGGGRGPGDALRTGDSRTGGAPPAVAMGPGGTVEPAAGRPPPVQEARRMPETAIGYEPDGRRDPFVNPIGRGAGGQAGAERPGGLSGLAVDEAVLRGVLATRNGRLAVLEAPDARTYVVRRADRLFDGTVQQITSDSVLFLRDAVDSAPVAEPEVTKRLRDTESVR